MEYHTNLNKLLSPTWVNISDFNWLLSDLDAVNFSKCELPIDFSENYSTLSSEDFKKVIESNIQIIWGVIAALKKSENPKFNNEKFPYVEGNDNVWKNNEFQVENAVFEITAWDSSYTIVKFKDEEFSEKFKNYFNEALELDKYKF